MKHNRIMTTIAAAALVLGMAACSSSSKEEEPADQAAIVGSWQLSKVFMSETEGAEPEEVQEAGHASMFGEKDNVCTFNADGTGTLLIVEGDDKTETALTWTTNEDGSYTVTAEEAEIYLYDPVDDVLMREFSISDPYIYVLNVYARK